MTNAFSAAQSPLEMLMTYAAKLERFAMGLLRLGLVVVLAWIGGLKFAKYEADSIVPFVANSPLMSAFYQQPLPDYRAHMNREGELKPENRAWHEANGTYAVSYGLGVTIVGIGILIALGFWSPLLGVMGSTLLIGMSLTTLSFLVTTPEAWVPALGDSAHGFPYLSGVGRLVIKDSIMLGAALVTLAESAKHHLVSRSL